MARQSFMTRLVLGRSAFQVPDESSPNDQQSQQQSVPSSTTGSAQNVQQYDRQGHPQNPRSKELMRQSRRAQNDVLTAVGVCVRVDKNGRPVASHGEDDPELRPAVKAILKENDYGLFLATVDWVLFCLADLCLLGLRQRLQAFQFYSGIPFSSVLKTEWRYYSTSKFLFAGTLPSVLFRRLNSAGPQTFRDIYNHLTRRFVWRVTEPRRKQHIRTILDVLENILKTATFAMIAPIEIFATLQRLDLVPGWPLLPHLWGAVPLTVFGPFQRTTSNTALVNHATAFLTSPVVLLWILLYVKQQVDERLFLYIRLALPKPSGPDLDSIEAAVMEDLNNSHILGLGRCNARQQIKDDLGKLYSNFQGFRAASMSWTPWENMRWTHITTLDSATEGPSDPQNLSSGYASNDGIQLLDSDGVVDLNSTVHPTSPQQDALEDSLAQSTVSPGSPEAAELSQELQAVFMADSNNGSQASAAFNESEENISSTECLRAIHHRHHVTALTAHMADTLAMHLSTHLADLLLLPLEALFVRSVALNFLSAAASKAPSGPAAGWRNQVFPLRSWFGGGIGPGGFRGYITNMALCGVCELAVGMGIWQLSSGAAWLMGRRWFGWGKF